MNYRLAGLKEEYMSLKNEIVPVVERVLSNAEFILGTDLVEFEKNFAKFCGVKYCAGTSSGTSALFLAAKALGIKNGDEVIVPSLAFASDAEAVLECGAKPVYAEVEADTFLIDPKDIEKRITPKTKAVLVVHLHGLVCDMEKISHICKTHQLRLIEDCAQSHGAEYFGKLAGSFGDVACFSFFPAKNLGCYGDGGAIVTNSLEIKKKVDALRNHGRQQDKYIYFDLGYNERLDNLQAAVLNVKLQHLTKWNEQRNRIASTYKKYFLENGIQHQKIPAGRKSSYYVFTVVVEDRKKLMYKLNEASIATGIYYPVPLHLQPAYAHLGYKLGDFPITEKLSDSMLSIPVHPYMTEHDAEIIARKVIGAAK